MKIGWTKLTMGLEFDFNTARANAGHERGPIARNLMKRGHHLFVYTPITRREEKIRNEIIETGEQVGEWDNRFLADIIYEPEGLPDKLDVLIVENGALNFTWKCSYTQQSQMRRIVDIINAHKGLVVYIQGDPDLPFPFYKMARSIYDWYHEENPYRLGNKKDNQEEYGWATYDEIFKDKKWIMAVRSKRFEDIIDAFDGSRTKLRQFVDEGLVELKYMFAPQPNEYFDRLNVNSETKYDVFCTGYPRNREKDFFNLFLYLVKYFTLASCGTWEKGKNVEYKEECEELGMKCLGFIDGFYNLYHEINSSICALHLGVSRTKKLGWITGRWTEALFCKTNLFFDEQLLDYDNYMDSYFAVNTNNVYDKYKGLMRLTHEERIKLWAYQYDQIKGLTIGAYNDIFEGICVENGIKLKPDKKFIEKYSEVHNEEEISSGVEYTDDEISEIKIKMLRIVEPKKSDVKTIVEDRKKARMERKRLKAERKRHKLELEKHDEHKKEIIALTDESTPMEDFMEELLAENVGLPVFSEKIGDKSPKYYAIHPEIIHLLEKIVETNKRIVEVIQNIQRGK